MTTRNPSVIWADTTDHNGTLVKLVGTWLDILAYYEDLDGNVWSVNTSSRWAFAAHDKRVIGETLRGELIR